MILNNEQNDRFFDTMDSLLYYVNERFRVVEASRSISPARLTT